MVKRPFFRHSDAMVNLGSTSTFDHTYGGYGQQHWEGYGQLGRGSATHYQTLNVTQPYVAISILFP